MRLKILVTVLPGAMLALAVTGVASPATVTNHKLSGIASLVSCPTTSRCVVAGESASGHGEIIGVDKGKPGRGTVVKPTLQFSAISCPSRAGCWALGVTNNNADPVLVKISSAGRVTKTITAHPSVRGVTLTAMSCVSMTACEVAGLRLSDGPPFPIEVGSWTGKKLSLRTVRTPGHSTETIITQISCHGTYCVAVGFAEYGSEVTRAAVLAISHGRPGKARTTNQALLSSVSCVSSARCYAIGANDAGAGILTTITNGVASSPHTTPAVLSGIACAGSACTVAAQVPAGSGSDGELIAVSSGKLTGTVAVESAVASYSDIANRGSGGDFAAIGPGQKSGSELTLGTALTS